MEALQDYERAPLAVDVLGRIGDCAVVPALIGMLKDERPNVRCSAAEALRKIGDPSARPALKETAHDRDAGVCWEAAYALRALGEPGGTEILFEIFHDVERRRTVFAGSKTRLRQLRNMVWRTAALPALIDVWWNERDEALLSTVVDILLDFGSEITLPRKILAERSFSVQDMLNLLDRITRIYDCRQSPRRAAALPSTPLFVFPPIEELCRQVMTEPDIQARAGAEAILNSLTLLRGSQEAPDQFSDQLLRPTEPRVAESDPAILLRPSEQEEVSHHHTARQTFWRKLARRLLKA